MKKLLNVKNFIVALVLVVGLTGIASFAASGPIATVNYVTKNGDKEFAISSDNNQLSTKLHEFKTDEIIFNINVKNANNYQLNLKDEENVYHDLDIESDEESIKVDLSETLNFLVSNLKEDSKTVYTLNFDAQEESDVDGEKDFSINIEVDKKAPEVEIYLGSVENKIDSEDKIKSEYTTNELIIKVKDENFEPSKKTYSIEGIAQSNDEVEWNQIDDYWKTTVTLKDSSKQTINVKVSDQAKNPTEISYEKSFIIDTQAPIIEVGIKGDNDENGNVYQNINNLNISITDASLIPDETIIEVGEYHYQIHKDEKGVICNEIIELTTTDSNTPPRGKCTASKTDDTFTLEITNLPDDEFSIHVAAVDKFNRQNSFSLNNLVVDTKAPFIESITFNNKPYNSQEINNYNEAQRVRLVIDEKYLDTTNFKVNLEMLKEQIAQQDEYSVEWTEENGKHVAIVKFDSDGEYRLDFEVYDLAKNKTSSGMIAFEIDQTPPKIEVSATNHDKIETEGDNPIELGFYNSKLTIKAEIIEEHLLSTKYYLTRVEDNSPISLEHFSDQDLDVTFNDPDSNSNISLEDGNYELDINVEDSFGNVLNEKITFTIDGTKPVVSPYSYTNNDEEVKPNQNNETGILYFDKNIDVKFNVEDKNLDLDKSKITIVKKDESLVYSLRELLDKEDSFIKLPTFDEDGEYQVELSNIQDMAGNVVEKKITKIVIDTKAPDIQIKDQENVELKPEFEKGYFYNQLVLNLSISDDNHNSSFETYSLERKNDKSNIPTEIFKDELINDHKLELDFNNHIMPGEYTLTVRAMDEAGNETVKKIKFTIDRTAPVVSDFKLNGKELFNDQLKGDNRKFYFNQDTVVTFEVKEEYLDLENSLLFINNDEYRLDSDKLTIKRNGENSIIQLPKFGDEGQYKDDGEYKVELVNIQDKASNEGNTIEPITIVIDTVKPEFEFLEEYSTFSNDSQTINFEINDTNYKQLTYTIVHKDYTKKDSEGTSESSTVKDQQFIKPLLDDGSYSLTFTAEDWAGNTETFSEKEIIIDKVAPVVSAYKLNNEIRKDGEGVKYYPGEQLIKIYINEYHFDSSKVEIDLTGEWNLVNDWKKVTDPKDQYYNHYVATIKVEQDGYYELESVKVEDQVGNKTISKPEAGKFVIDTVKPRIEVSDVKNDFYYKKGDKVTINVSIDETNFNKNLSTYTIYRKESLNSEEKVYLSGNITSQTDFKLPTLTENGEYRVVLTAKDMSDNQVEKDTKLHFYIDHHDPKVSIKPVTTNTANGSQQNVSEVVIGLSATDDWKLANTKYTVKRNNEVINVPKQGEWEDFKLSFKDEGYYQVEIETGDEAGTKTVKETLEFTIDRTSPAQLSIVGNANHHNSTTSVKDGESYSAPRVNLQFTAQDAYSFNKITVDVTKNGKAYASQTFDVKDVRKDFTNAFGKNANYSLSEEGEYEVTFTAYDQAGNQSNQKLSFEIDRTKPIITSNIEDGKYYNEDFLPEFTLDQPERDEFTFINIDEKNYKNGIPFLISDKVYTISALATDKAQNTVDYNATITIDKTSPTIGISNLITGFFKDTLSPSIFYNDTNLDASKVSIKLNNVELGAGVGDENGYTKEINIDKDGKYTLEVSIGDLATNVSKQTIDFVLDNEKPVISIKNNISGELYNKAWLPELEVLEEYGYDIVVATLNGEEYDLTQPITREGKNVLYIQVMDKSGNLDEMTVEFILDLTPPKVIIENAETNQLVKDGDEYETSLDLKVYLDYVSQEGQEDTERIYDISLNGETIPLNNVTKENGRTVYHLSLTEFKDYNLTVKASDNAGNKTVETINFTLGDKDIFTKIYENKPVFYSIITITGLSVLIAGIYTIRISKKKNNEETEE